MSETDDAFEIKAELPGVNEDDVQVSVTDNRLLIKGEKHDEREDKDNKK